MYARHDAGSGFRTKAQYTPKNHLRKQKGKRLGYVEVPLYGRSALAGLSRLHFVERDAILSQRLRNLTDGNTIADRLRYMALLIASHQLPRIFLI